MHKTVLVLMSPLMLLYKVYFVKCICSFILLSESEPVKNEKIVLFWGVNMRDMHTCLHLGQIQQTSKRKVIAGWQRQAKYIINMLLL